MGANTPLLALLRQAAPEQRDRLATLAGTSVNYLYQLAVCSRGTRLTADLAFRIEDATRAVHKETKGKLPVIPARVLSGMCAIPDTSKN